MAATTLVRRQGDLAPRLVTDTGEVSEIMGALATVERLHKRLANRRPDVRQREDYYEGKQPLNFASDEWAAFHSQRYKNFSDNWCAPVANAPVERKNVMGIRLGESTDSDNKLWRAWQSNEMEAQSSQGFLASVVSGTSFVMVWADDDGEPKITWLNPDQAEIETDPEDPRRRRAGIHSWVDGDDEFCTLYTREWVWKFWRKNDRADTSKSLAEQRRSTSLSEGGWEAREVRGEPWPAVNPLGEVPLVEFPNRPTLRGQPISDIAGVMAMQDAVNLLWAYLFTASDYSSMPARVILGQSPPKLPVLDKDGNKIGERDVDMPTLQKQRMLWLSGKDTKIGQFDAARLDVFTAVIEQCVGHIAAQTRTPPHYLVANKGMNNLSGDALTASETGLAMKTRESQTYDTPNLREVFRLCALVQEEYGLADACRSASILWADVENRSQAQTADAMLKERQVGYPFEYLLEKHGHSPDEITRIMAMKRAEEQAVLSFGNDALAGPFEVKEAIDVADADRGEGLPIGTGNDS